MARWNRATAGPAPPTPRRGCAIASVTGLSPRAPPDPRLRHSHHAKDSAVGPGAASRRVVLSVPSRSRAGAVFLAGLVPPALHGVPPPSISRVALYRGVPPDPAAKNRSASILARKTARWASWAGRGCAHRAEATPAAGKESSGSPKGKNKQKRHSRRGFCLSPIPQNIIVNWRVWGVKGSYFRTASGGCGWAGPGQPHGGGRAAAGGTALSHCHLCRVAGGGPPHPLLCPNWPGPPAPTAKQLCKSTLRPLTPQTRQLRAQ